MVKNETRKLWIIFVSFLVILALAVVIFYIITYNNPIIIGDSELKEKYSEVSIKYSHDLMTNFIGIPAHAQLVIIQRRAGIEILHISFFPPSRTKVWHSDSDIPYWEIGY